MGDLAWELLVLLNESFVFPHVWPSLLLLGLGSGGIHTHGSRCFGLGFGLLRGSSMIVDIFKG